MKRKRNSFIWETALCLDAYKRQEMRRIPYRLRTENALLCSEGSRRIITEAGDVYKRQHEDKPFYGTVYKKESEYMGRKFSPYHLYQEMNYMQHEIFLLEELTDYCLLYTSRCV